MNHMTQWSFAAGAALALGLAAPASAQIHGRGDSPGTLGTEVPLDSPEADSAYHVRLPTDTAEARRFRDAVQKLLADHEGALALATEGAQSSDPRLRRLAQRLEEDVRRLDDPLRRIATRGERFELAGASYQEERAATIAAAGEVRSAGPARDETFLSRTAQLLERAVGTAGENAGPARRESRLLLGSHLDREKQVLGADLAAVRAIAPGPQAHR